MMARRAKARMPSLLYRDNASIVGFINASTPLSKMHSLEGCGLHNP